MCIRIFHPNINFLYLSNQNKENRIFLKYIELKGLKVLTDFSSEMLQRSLLFQTIRHRTFSRISPCLLSFTQSLEISELIN